MITKFANSVCTLVYFFQRLVDQTDGTRVFGEHREGVLHLERTVGQITHVTCSTLSGFVGIDPEDAILEFAQVVPLLSQEGGCGFRGHGSFGRIGRKG